jgi:hypothetical protein
MDVPLVENFLDLSLDLLILQQRAPIDWPIGQWCTKGHINGVFDLIVERYHGR